MMDLYIVPGREACGQGVVLWATASRRPALGLLPLLLLLILLLAPAAGRAQKVAAGSGFSHFIRPDGTLWGSGFGNNGQVGDGTGTSRTLPVQIGTLTSWQSLASGNFHTEAIQTNGTLWAWGRNDKGELGDGTNFNRTAPVRVGLASNWQSVAVGSQFTLAIRTDGTLWAWGRDESGQLGDGAPDTNTNPNPVQIGTDTNWQSVAAGSNHSLAIRTDGTLWAWGLNGDGQLGLGNAVNRSVPTQVGSGTTWQRVAAGPFTLHSVAIQSNGTLWAWGRNVNNQLGDGTTTGRLSPIQIGSATTWARAVVGPQHTLALRTDGSLWGWGNNDYGQLGDGSTTNQAAPVQLGSVTSWQGLAAGNYQTLGQRTDNSVWAWGWNPNGQVGSPDAPNPLRLVPAQVGTALDWASPALGNDFTQARKTNGELWSCGQNISGQLGQGQPVKALITSATRAGTDLWQSTSAGFRHGVGIRPDGSLWAWGQNGSGQLGQGIAYGNPPVPTPLRIGLATDWQSVAAGFEYTLAVRTDGTLWAWGLNSSGQLGDGSLITRTAPVQIGSLTTWQSVAAGGNHSLAIQTNGTLWAWGNNSNGQLGDGTTTPRTAPGQIGSLTNWQRVAAGGNYSLALQTAGSLWAWGLNGSGQLGDGTFTNRTTPVPVATGSTWQAIAVGSAHSVALATDGGLWTTGLNGNGQLGDGSTTNRSTLARVGSAAWLAVGTSGTALHTAAVRADGSLWAWGQNNYGQTGQPATAPAPLLVYPLLPAAVVATPGSGAAGSTVTLTGLNLFGATAVTIGGVAATYSIINNSTITAVVPVGLPASVTITVTTAGGTSTPSAAFAVLLKVVGSSPAPNARQAPLGSAAVVATYSEPVAPASVTAGALAVFSGQAGGSKAGSLSVSGATVSFAATAGLVADFRPGELVQATTTSAPTTATGLVAVPKAWQFYALAGGSGRGNFPGGNPAVTASPTGSDANGVAVADVNEDGRLDLLVPTGTNGQVRVLLGDGAGGFAAGTALTGLASPVGVTPADLNNDGHLDLLIPSISGSRVLVRLGDGAGNFSAVADLTTAADTRNCIAADLNNDGILDVVAASVGGNALYRFLGTGSGTFGAATILTGLAVPVSLAAGDFDNDGWLDLAVSNYGSAQVALYRNLGTGAGTFGTVAFTATRTNPNAVAVADINADGLPDLLTANEGNTTGLSYLRNTSTGAVLSFASAPAPVTGGVANGLQVADVNADGTLDVLLTQASRNLVNVLTNDGTGTFVSIGTAVVGTNYGIAAADFDNDGDVDFVTNRLTNVQVRLNLPPAPIISGIVPSPGGLGQAITLTGTDFGGATALSINGAAVALANIISNTGTSLTVRVPNAATASGNVSLTTPSGTGTRAFTLLTPPGNALALDGVDEYVRVADSPALDFGTGNFTVEAWVLKQAPTVGFAHAVGPGGKWNTGATPGTNEWLLQTTTGGNDDRPSFVLESNSSGAPVTYTCGATNPLLIGRWYHLAGVRDGNFLRLYVDGVAQPATALPAGTAVNNVAGRDLLLGAIANNTTAAFFANERLDELRVWNLARTPAEIVAGQTGIIAPGTAGLVAYYNFDAGTAATASTGANGTLTTLYDLTANNNHGTLINYVGAALSVGNTASNWVESYAAVRPTATPATAASSGGFTATWTAPALGTAPGYLLEVAADAAFASPVAGSPFAVAGVSRAITGLAVSSTYYYRVRAEKPSVSGQGSVSNVVSVATTALPVAVGQNLTVFLTAAGTAAALPINANNGSTANGGAVAVSSLSLSPSTFTCANVGANAATFTVTDASGATSTAAITVTVIDNLAPAMRLPYAPALALANVPEAANYGILYQLDMPANGSFGSLPAVPYALNNASVALPANPARVAYFMQLINGSGTRWVWASMNNFAPNLTQLGLPHVLSNPVAWRTAVTGLNVASNNGGTLVTGNALGAGRVEMWPSNYGTANDDAVPGASASTYDFGDGGSSTANGYGSFQVHNLANAQTVLAYNAWNTGGTDDVGIGSQVGGSGHPDWTFANNLATGNYTVKTLYILVPNVAIAATQSVALALDASGNASVTAAQLLTAAATDNCSAVTATVAPSAFTCANVGANAVTLTLTDASGNVSRQSATVTVAVPPTPTTTWSGTISTDWTDCRNWSYGKVPDAATHAVIPAGRPFAPALTTGTLAVADLGIASGASLSTGSAAVLQLSGNFANDGSAALAGPVQLVGSAATQTLGGSAATSFGTVLINKPTGSVALGRDLAIGTALTMSSGTLATGSFAVALGSAATLTETETSYVSGTVEATRTLATHGSGSSFGGIGVTLTPAAGSTALPGSTRVRRTTGSPATNLTNANVGIARYFAITPTVDAGLDVTLTLTYRTGELGAIAENRLRLFRSEAGPTGPWARVDFTTFDPAANTATRANIARFSTWTLGSADAPLPVALTAFTAEVQGAAVALAWQTASETNSARFEVERSADGRGFERIGTVAAAGSSSSPRRYGFVDTQVPKAPSPQVPLYYRLRQVDADGTAVYSPVRVVQLLSQSAHQLTVFPNPARRRLTVAGATEGAPVLVLDALGREIARTPAGASGEARLTLPAGLAAGVYLVRSGPQTTRLVVEE